MVTAGIGDLHITSSGPTTCDSVCVSGSGFGFFFSFAWVYKIWKPLFMVGWRGKELWAGGVNCPSQSRGLLEAGGCWVWTATESNKLLWNRGKKSLSLLVHTPLSWGRRVSLKRHSSQANIILEIYSVDLHLGCFPRGGVLAKPALFEGIGTAEYLYFSHFHCMAGHIFLILCNLLILLEKKIFGSGWRKPQHWSSWHDCTDRPWNRVSLWC